MKQSIKIAVASTQGFLDHLLSKTKKIIELGKQQDIKKANTRQKSKYGQASKCVWQLDKEA